MDGSKKTNEESVAVLDHIMTSLGIEIDDPEPEIPQNDENVQEFEIDEDYSQDIEGLKFY